MSEEGFHEIQLNGKQLVFLFMATTVMAVVIFLCGVMVGRGVRAERGEATTGAAEQRAVVPEPEPQAPPSSTATPKSNAPSSPAADDDYYRTLNAEKAADKSLAPPSKSTPPPPPPAESKATDKAAETKAAEAKPAETKPAAPKPTEKVAEKSKPTTDQSALAAMTSGGFAVQITALRDRGEADAIVKRLVGKGYPAYVLNPLPGKPPVYRVQVGRYQNRGDADRIASRLQKEEQFSPWVTR
jgi:cell division septation protein DedD